MRHTSHLYEPPPERHWEETFWGRTAWLAVLVWACLLGVFFYVALR